MIGLVQVQNAEGYEYHAWSVLAAVETADALARGLVQRGVSGIKGGDVERVLNEAVGAGHGSLIEFALAANTVYRQLIARHYQCANYTAEYERYVSEQASYDRAVLAALDDPDVDPGEPPTRPEPPFPDAVP